MKRGNKRVENKFCFLSNKNKRAENKFCFLGSKNKRAENKFCFLGSKNKRAQFYLVAAILILLAVVGLTTVTTYAVTQSEPRQIKDFSAELKEEGPRIIDYGIVNSENLTLIFEDFTEYEYAPYFLKKSDNASIVFLYGNETDFYVSRYMSEYTGTVSATLGGASTAWDQIDIYSERAKVEVSGDSLEVTVLDQVYTFDIKSNEMFYFVIAQEREGEKYVEKN